MSDRVVLDGDLSLLNQLDGDVSLDAQMDGEQGTYTRYDWRGYSAYEIAVQHGFVGTEEEWIASLQGEDGPQGPQGYSPVKGVDYWTAADKQEIVEDTAEAIDVPVEDVQINGASIVSNGIAEIPVASSSQLGVVKIGNGLIVLSGNQQVVIVKATDAEIKAGTHNYDPIVPSQQHKAIFYGLAKAAGDTTQSASSNAVGTYTDEAKAAIRSMLGIETLADIIEAVHDSYAAAEEVSF